MLTVTHRRSRRVGGLLAPAVSIEISTVVAQPLPAERWIPTGEQQPIPIHAAAGRSGRAAQRPTECRHFA
jgi:hypothetical protein